MCYRASSCETLHWQVDQAAVVSCLPDDVLSSFVGGDNKYVSLAVSIHKHHPVSFQHVADSATWNYMQAGSSSYWSCYRAFHRTPVETGLTWKIKFSLSCVYSYRLLIEILLLTRIKIKVAILPQPYVSQCVGKFPASPFGSFSK